MRKHLLLLTTAAAIGAGARLAPARPVASAPLPSVTLAKGEDSAWKHGETHLVVDQEITWVNLWREHAPGSIPPAVDFTSEVVYVVFLGAKPTRGYFVETVALTDTGSTVHWDIKGIEPAASCNLPPTITNPYHFVKAPKTGLLALIFQVNEIIGC
jgi:protease stability complex PrcB-like protein